MSIYDQMAPPQQSGDFPPKFEFSYPGASITGTVVNMRMIPARGEMAAAPVIEVQSSTDGVIYSVICAPVVLYRELYNKRPQVGQSVTVTFTGHEGQTKLFTLDVHGGAQAPVAAPPQAPAPPQQPVAQAPGQPAWAPPQQQAAPPQQPAWGAPPQ